MSSEAEEMDIENVFEDIEQDDSILDELVPMEDVPQSVGKVILVHGWQGTGKTHFAYEFVKMCLKNRAILRAYPKVYALLQQGKKFVALKDRKKWTEGNGMLLEGCPVIFYDTEAKSYDISQKFPRPKGFDKKEWILWMKGYVPLFKKRVPDGEQSLLKLIKLCHALKRTQKKGTLIIDTASDINNWIHHYIKKRVLGMEIEQSLEPKHYEHRTNIWQYLLHLFREMDMNVVLITRHKSKWGMKADWKGKQRFSKLEEWKMDIWEGIPFMMHFEISLDKPGDSDEDGKVIRRAEIIKNYLEGEEIEDKIFRNITPIKLFEWVATMLPDPPNLEEVLKRSEEAKKKKAEKKQNKTKKVKKKKKVKQND